MPDLVKPPPVPCGSCPYRCDVPSGIWSQDEYEKLPPFDGEIIEQLMKGATALFMCHQRDGRLCGGWLAAHGIDKLLALRLHSEELDPSVWEWETDVQVFGSGQEAYEHGVRDIEEPGPEAERMIAGLLRKRGETYDQDHEEGGDDSRTLGGEASPRGGVRIVRRGKDLGTE